MINKDALASTLNDVIAYGKSVQKSDVPAATKTRRKTDTPAINDKRIDAIGDKKSDFKSVRHLVEYLLVKNKDIRFDQADKIVKKAFPGHNFDVGMFTWFKLDYIKNGKLMFKEDIEKQLQS